MIGPAELADPYGPAAAPALADAGALSSPLLVIDLDRPASAAQVAAAAAAARASGRILVGVTTAPAHPLAEALDLTLTTAVTSDRAMVTCDQQAALGQIEPAVTANPQAAIILASLLRWSGRLPVSDALEAESLAYSTLLAGPEFARWLRGRPAKRPRPTQGDPVIIDRQDNTLTITLNRPDRRNAFGAELRSALVAALELAQRADLKVVLQGNGPAFCSGGDLDEFGTAPDPVSAHFIRAKASPALLMHAIKDRIEVRVHGACVGAGVELPAFAGTINAAEGTVFRLPELAMGLIPGAGGTVSLPRRIGRWRTLHLALTGQNLDLASARAWGLTS